VLARVKQAQRANGRARGELFAIEPLAAARSVDGAVAAMGPLARRWARTKLDDLLVAGDARTVTRHALAYGLVSPYTSFVAVGTDVVVQGGVTRSVAVPVAVPAGMRWDAVREETTPATGEDVSVRDSSTTSTQPVATTAPRPDNKPARTKQPASKTGDKNERADAPRAQGLATADAAPAASAQPAPAPVDVPEEDADEGGAPSRSVAALDDEAEPGEDSLRAEVVTGVRSRRYRLSLSLGGGLALDASRTAPLAAIAGRLDVGRRANLVGVEADLWLVDGAHGEGRFLVDYTRRGLARWLELSLGAGVLVDGDGAGPAGALSLRGHLPAQPALSGYLRYDAAWRDDAHHAFTLGVEWGF
jgi:hypothetical protein